MTTERVLEVPRFDLSVVEEPSVIVEAIEYLESGLGLQERVYLAESFDAWMKTEWGNLKGMVKVGRTQKIGDRTVLWRKSSEEVELVREEGPFRSTCVVLKGKKGTDELEEVVVTVVRGDAIDSRTREFDLGFSESGFSTKETLKETKSNSFEFPRKQ